MLVAHTKQGDILNLLTMTQLEINQLGGQTFLCPGCHGLVILKNGLIKLPHFAHQTRQKHHCGLSEAESAAHLEGKQLLQVWGNEEIVLEAYLPQLQQRPDVLLADGTVAIEIQYSALSIQRLLQRMAGYREYGYQQWWLLGGSMLPKDKLSRLQQAFCGYSVTLGGYFWTIKEEDRMIELNYNVQLTGNGQYRCQTKQVLLQQRPLFSLFELPITGKMGHQWLEDASFANKQVRRLEKQLVWQTPKVVQLQGIFYSLGRHLLHLPSWVYRESRFTLFFQESILLYRYLFIQYSNQSSVELLWQKWYQHCQFYQKEWYFPLVNQQTVWRDFFRETATFYYDCH